ncbi:MAG: hypothetical protein OEM52_11765, partial [bacterium]|nr:hypothetical protein [bacterium]
MKLVTTGLLVLALIVAAVPVVKAQEYSGGMGTNWVSSAMTIPPGAAMFSFHGRFWAGSIGTSENIKNGSSAFNLNFGYTRKIELGISQIVYQDYNWGKPIYGKVRDKFMAPGDLSLRAKLGNLSTTMGEYYFINAFTVALRYRISKISNVPLTPYFSSGMSPSLTWSGSWYSRPLYPEESQFFGIQLTYNNHNDCL